MPNYTRTMSDATKQKIGSSVKQAWSNKSEIEKDRIRQKQSETMRYLWSQVPKEEEEQGSE